MGSCEADFLLRREKVFAVLPLRTPILRARIAILRARTTILRGRTTILIGENYSPNR